MIKFDSEKFRIAVELKQGNKDLRDIAEEIGTSTSTIHRVTSGKRMDIDTLVKIINWLDMPITKFFY